MDQKQLIEYKSVLAQAVEIGKYLLASGAEVSRVENTIERIMYAYGALEVNAFVVQAFILASVRLCDGTECIRARRVANAGTDLGRLERLNSLARQVCEQTPPAAQVSRELKDILAFEPNPWLTCLGYFLSVSTMAVFFGGTIMDSIAAGVISLVMFFSDRYLRKSNYNVFVYTLLSSLMAGWLAVLFVRFGFGDHVDKIMIGDIMILIPGLALCNAMKDILHKDHLTGMSRFVEALATTLFIAFGFFIASATLGGGLVNSHLPSPSDWVQILCSGLGSVGFALFFLAKVDKLPLALLGGALSWTVYLVVFHWYPDVFTASAVAAACVCVYAECAARLVKAPAIVFMITAVIPLLPGSYLYYAITGLLTGDSAQFSLFGSRALAATLGVEGGILIAYFVFMHILDWKHRLRAKRMQRADRIPCNSSKKTGL